jgi:hypothetical protein
VRSSISFMEDTMPADKKKPAAPAKKEVAKKDKKK